MDAKNLVRILKEVPETHLRVLKLCYELVGEDGTVDPEKVAFHSTELQEAIKEAEQYSKETRVAVRCLNQLAHL